MTEPPDALPAGLVAVVLAAGAGTRYTGPTHKLLAPFRGRRVIDHAVDAALDAGFEHVVVVRGELELSLPQDRRLSIVANPRPGDGQGASLGVGIDRAAELGASAIVVGLGDSPLVGPATWREVAVAPGVLAMTDVDGTLAPPTKIDASLWSVVVRAGDEGARALVRERPDLVTRVPCTALSPDIDTEEDLARWS